MLFVLKSKKGVLNFLIAIFGLTKGMSLNWRYFARLMFRKISKNSSRISTVVTVKAGFLTFFGFVMFLVCGC